MIAKLNQALELIDGKAAELVAEVRDELIAMFCGMDEGDIDEYEDVRFSDIIDAVHTNPGLFDVTYEGCPVASVQSTDDDGAIVTYFYGEDLRVIKLNREDAGAQIVVSLVTPDAADAWFNQETDKYPPIDLKIARSAMVHPGLELTYTWGSHTAPVTYVERPSYPGRVHSHIRVHYDGAWLDVAIADDFNGLQIGTKNADSAIEAWVKKGGPLTVELCNAVLASENYELIHHWDDRDWPVVNVETPWPAVMKHTHLKAYFAGGWMYVPCDDNDLIVRPLIKS